TACETGLEWAIRHLSDSSTALAVVRSRHTGEVEMTATVTEKDLRALVELLAEARRDNPMVGLPAVVLELAQTLVRCDVVSFHEYEPAAQRVCLEQEGSVAVIDPDYGFGDSDPFWVHFWDCTPCSYSCASGDERTVTTISDFYSQSQWRQTGMY